MDPPRKDQISIHFLLFWINKIIIHFKIWYNIRKNTILKYVCTYAYRIRPCGWTFGWDFASSSWVRVFSEQNQTYSCVFGYVYFAVEFLVRCYISFIKVYMYLYYIYFKISFSYHILYLLYWIWYLCLWVLSWLPWLLEKNS